MNKLSNLWVCVLLIGTAQCLGYPGLYGPFENNEKVMLYPVVECQCVSLDTLPFSGNNQFIRYHSDYLVLNISSGENGERIELIDQHQSLPLYQSKDLGFSLMLLDKVRWGYLNDDFYPDYILEAWTGGSGLAASYCHIVFLLSEENQYSMQTLVTVSPGPEDFVDLDADGHCEYIHTAFIYGEAGADGREHNYWVYSLLQFDKNSLVTKPGMDARFPKWIMYSNQENHEATKQLSNEQKHLLLKEQMLNFIPN